MNQEKWLNWRRQGIGASDAPVIMGVSPWKTPYQLWEEKIFGGKEVENFAMKRGKDLEVKALEYFSNVLEMEFDFQGCVEHSGNSWMRATLDGVNWEKKVVLEIKCPGKEDHALAMQGKIPDKYYPQLQHQLAVVEGKSDILYSGSFDLYYGSFDGKDGVLIKVARDDGYIDQLIEAESKFWNCVLQMEPPDLIDRDWQNMEENTKWQALAERYLEVNKICDDLSKEKDFLRSELINLSEGKNSKGSGLKLTKSVCKGSIEYEKAFDTYVRELGMRYPEISLTAIDFNNFRKKSFEKYYIKSL